MPDRPSPEIELLRAAYAAFNARDFDAAFATMAPDVAWPRAFKGGWGGESALDIRAVLALRQFVNLAGSLSN